MGHSFKLRVVELYAGTARSAEAFRKWKRCKISLLVDNNRWARDSYLANFRRAPYELADLSRVNADEIEARAGGKVHILLGCPPCQGFSDTGKRDPDDPRNGHLTRFGTIALRLKPWAIAMENVPLAGSSPSFEHFLKRIARAGYRWTAGILNSALHGSAQCRHRLVFVGIRSDVGSSPRIPSPSHGGDWSYFSYRLQQMVRIDADHVGMLGVAPAAQRMRIGLPYVEEGVGSLRIPTVEEVMAGLPRFQTKEAKLSSHERWQHSASMIRRMSAVPEGGRWKGGRDHFAQSYGRLHRKGLARTITTYFSNPGSGRFWHPSDERCISIREAARIQGFPDTFLFPVLPSQAAVLVGNALDGSISDLIYRTIRRCLE